MNKKSFIKISILFLFLLQVLSCRNVNNGEQVKSNDKANKAKEELKDKLVRINSEIEELVMSANYDALLPYYTDDIIISPAFQPSIKGKEAVRKSYEKNKREGLKYHSLSGMPEEIWECEKYVYDRGTFGLSVSAKDHPKPVAYYGSYFTIWQKEKDGALKTKYLIFNLDFNPYE